jgi:hypothetical protein
MLGSSAICVCTVADDRMEKLSARDSHFNPAVFQFLFTNQRSLYQKKSFIRTRGRSVPSIRLRCGALGVLRGSVHVTVQNGMSALTKLASQI